MGDWLHCNTCFHQPGDGQVKFNLTSCGHIYCEKCVEEGTKNQCKLCGSNCNTIPLSRTMKPDVEAFFSNPTNLLKEKLKQAENMMKQTEQYQKQLIQYLFIYLQVVDFQQNHRRRLFSFHKEKLNKQHLVVNQYNALEREMMRVKEENSYLKRLINERGLGGHNYNNRVSPRGVGSSSPQTERQYRGTPVAVSSGNSHSLSQSLLMSQHGMSHNFMGRSSITSNRVSVRTPPSGGRLGTVGTPSPRTMPTTPLSVPHPINLGGTTPSPR